MSPLRETIVIVVSVLVVGWASHCETYDGPEPQTGECHDQASEWTGWGMRLWCPHRWHRWDGDTQTCRCEVPDGEQG